MIEQPVPIAAREHITATNYLIQANEILKTLGLSDEEVLEYHKQLLLFRPDWEKSWNANKAIADKRGIAWIRVLRGPVSVINFFGPWTFRFGNWLRKIFHRPERTWGYHNTNG
jgi:hypothetical protein